MRKIQDDSAPDFKIDSARQLVPITPDDDENGVLTDCCRGIWLSETTPKTISYLEADGTQRDGLLILPGPNMFIVKRLRATGTDAADYRAIF